MYIVKLFSPNWPLQDIDLFLPLLKCSQYMQLKQRDNFRYIGGYLQSRKHFNFKIPMHAVSVPSDEKQ